LAKQFGSQISLPKDPVAPLEAATKQYVDAAVAGGGGGGEARVIGELIMWPGAAASVPSKWLLCDGTAVSRTTYATLFALIGTNYGTGDGSTTFNLPDFRTRFPRGVGVGGTAPSLSGMGGNTEVTLVTANMPQHNHGSSGSHNHPYQVSATSGTSNATIMRGTATVASTITGAYNPANEPAHTHGTNGSDAPFNIVNPYLAIFFIIRALP
jgi:microcystin-dependent protein